MKMEPIMHQSKNSLTQFTDAQFLKMVTQLLLSVSVFSFLFSQSSLLSFLHSLKFYLSTFPYQLFTHTIDKNCIFLLCNGLLVFLAKYSGLVRSLSLSSPQDESCSSKNIIDYGSQSEYSMPQMKEPILETKEAEVMSIDLAENVSMGEGDEDKYCFTNQRETEPETEEAILDDHKEQKQGDGFVVSNEEEHEEHKEEETALVHVEEDGGKDKWSKDGFIEEEEEEVGNGMLSTEELNKKFDDFIRRMKAELRIEAQRQLIMV